MIDTSSHENAGDAPALLSLEGVRKSFDAVDALQPLSLAVSRGEILGLVGENGAGKSTLINLLSGVFPPDAGHMLFDGRAVSFSSPRDSLAAGIATIHQELDFFSHLSVAENMLLGERWPRRRWGGVDWRSLHAEAQRRLAAFELDIPTGSLFEQLTAAEKQEVAIANALSMNAKLLILDEPTASLSEPEVKRLISRLRNMSERGVTIIYVSHRLDEIFEVTNRVAVLRDGRLIDHYRTGDVNVDRLIHDMVGRPLKQVYPRTRKSPAETVLLEASHLRRTNMFDEISFLIRAGEIVGLTGLVGAGRSELARAIYGMYSVDSGSMKLCGTNWSPRNPQTALQNGLVYVPEERKRQGFVLEHSVRESISIGFSDLLSRLGLIDRRRETARIKQIVERYALKTSSLSQPMTSLSGGNQQKALLARWLERDPQVIILDEPTRGVDVAAKANIHQMIDRLADRGKAVLFISSDLPEVVGMSDRVLVMNRGRISAELSGEALSEHNIILAASGLYEQPADK